MKNHLSKLITLLFFVASASILSAQSFKNDAVIESEKIVTSFYFGVKNKMPYYRKNITTKRRIKINTLNGLEMLNKLYLPTLVDLQFTYELVFISAKTIKPNGDVFTVNKEQMQETTLPANYSSLYGFHGNVLQLAFENVAVGDVIEYNYTMVYTTSKGSGNWYINDEYTISNTFPILKGEYVFQLDDNSTGMFALANSNETIAYEKESNKYRITLTNIHENYSELYSIKKNNLPFIKYKITNSSFEYDDNWNSYFKYSVQKARKKEYFFGGKTVGELKKVALNGATTPTGKIDTIIQYLTNTYIKQPYAVYQYDKQYYIDLSDVSNMITLMDQIGIEAQVVFVKSKWTGPIIEDYYSTSQFNDALIEFIDENGKTRYWAPFSPFSKIGDISYEYQGTKALRIKRIKKDLIIDMIIVPMLSHKRNEVLRDVNIDITRENDQLKYQVEEHVIINGDNAKDDYLAFHLEYIDSSLTFYSDFKKSEYLFRYPNCKIDTFILENPSDSGSIEFTIRYNYNSRFGHQYSGVILEVKDLVGKIVFDAVPRTRKSNAHFDFAYTLNSTFNITSDAIDIDDNLFLSTKKGNDLATFESNYKINGASLEIDLKYEQKVIEIIPDNWDKYVAIMDHIFSFYNQKVLFNY